MEFILRGEKWKYLRCPLLRKNWGACLHGKKILKVSKKAKDLTELDTIIHEYTHAYCSDMCEESVLEFATDLAELLWKLGYRKGQTS